MSHPTVTLSAAPNFVADTIRRTAELGLSIDNAADAGTVTHLYCHPVIVSSSCPGCGQDCRICDHVERRLTDPPIAGHPSLLRVRIPRMVCANDCCEVTIFRASIGPCSRRRSLLRRWRRCTA
ncbi:transposase family protein [Corynebacterium nuruki]|uniref:transposase family protein n=1 Tax=Corynebacterium nuruki TaxID=1032851 RepID=UPI001EE67D11|nr:transposase family protein [Corynebacterium nuruki]